MSEKRVLFINPRHTYAPKNKQELGGVCLPVGPLLQAARLKEAGAKVEMHDENLRPLGIKETPQLIATGVLGPVYVEPALKLGRKLRKMFGPELPFAYGGPGVNGSVLSEESFGKLFPNAIYGNADAAIAKAAGVDVRAMPRRADTSFVSVYEQIPDADFTRYLEANPLPFYLSQGCSFDCSFCIAEHSGPDAMGEIHKVGEEYRNPKVLESDFKYLVGRAKKLGVRNLNIYLSNLDLFQTPKKLEEFADVVLSIRKDTPEVKIKMRGLATAVHFIGAHKHRPAAIEKMVEAGLEAVGFGVDGGPESWAEVGKKQNTIEICKKAIRVSRNVYGIRPQILEVAGFTKDSEDSLGRTVKFAREMAGETNAEVRPYLAKEHMPNLLQKSLRIKNSTYTDFSAWASSLSHPDTAHREMVNAAYAEMLNDPNNITVPVWVPSRKLTKAERAELEKRFPGKSFSDSLTAEECRELNVGSYDT